MATRRVGGPLGIALVSAVLAGLVVALVLSLVLDDGDEADGVPSLTLDPSAQATLTAPPNTSVGAAAPDFEFEELGSGDDVDFEEFRDGRPAVVNFFSRTCVPCVQEMPDLEAAHQRYGDRVAFLGLAYGDSPERALDLVEETGVTYETGRDVQGEAFTAFEGNVLPTTAFVDADGTITRLYQRRVQPDELEEALEELV